MRRQTTPLHELAIYAHFFGVPIEVSPVLVGGSGRYTEASLRNHKVIELKVDTKISPAALIVGAAYRATGIDTEGKHLSTHWLYCMSAGPTPTFGVSINWQLPSGASPLLGDPETPWIRLEQLEDLTMTWASPPPSFAVSQSQVGKRGWLVMSSLTLPISMGILIEEPNLPPTIAEGSVDIAISAKCSRTLQSIGFAALTCVDGGRPALFLETVG